MNSWQETKDKRIKRRGEFYWARFTKKGARIEESLHTRSFSIAQRMVDNIEEDILLGVNRKREKELFETGWLDFLSDKAKGIKTKVARPKTLYEYTSFGIRSFCPFFNSYRLTDIDESLWEKYVEWVREKNPEVLLFNHRKYLMGFLSWCKRKGKLREIPELFNPDLQNEEDEADGPGKEYSLAELSEMRERSKGSFKLYVLMGQFMAMRSSEITQLNKNRIDLQGRVIRLRKIDTKTAQKRSIPIYPEVWPPLLSQMGRYPESQYLFPNRADKRRPMDKTGFKKRWDEIRQANEEGGYKGFTGRFHDLKHTWITNSLRCGMNPVIVSKISGTSINVIMRTYLHLTDEDLAKDMLKLDLNEKASGTNNGPQP